MDPRWRDLQTLAMRQHGLFTAQQAEAVGFSRPALHYQVRAGFIVRRLRGVYRFVAYPPGDRDREAELMLWAGERHVVAFCHDTALSYFDLGDALPDKIHMTVPGRFRPRAPDDVVVHKAELAAYDIHREGILRYTNPLRTLLDVIVAAYPDDQLMAIHRQSLARGLVRRRDLDPASPQVQAYVDRHTKATAQRVSAWLERVDREG